MHVYNISKTERDKVLEKLAKFSLKDQSLKLKDLKIAETGDPTSPVIFDKDEKLFLGRNAENVFFPLLKDERILPDLPVITVDSGAVKFVCNGANIMRPGITKIDGQFEKTQLVVVKEQKFGKAIAVGMAMYSSQEMQSMQKGQVIENLHYVGDKIWNALKELGVIQG